MLVKTVALLNQTFRIDVRQVRTHLLRGAFAAAVLFMLTVLHDGIRWMSAPGLQFFSMLTTVSLIMLSMCGAFYFPSVITEEKEQQTLGLLRMAGVGPATLLLGKSTGRLGIILLLMAVTLPYWWLAVTLGGVTWGQVAAAGVVLATHLILVSQIGTFCSVVFRTTSKASVASIIVILALMIGPTILHVISSALWGWASPPSEFFSAAQYWFAPAQLSRVLASAYVGGLVSLQAVVGVLAALVLFGLSWLLFDVFNTYAVVEDAGSRRRGWRFGRRNAGSQRARSPRPSTSHAILWKDFHQFVGGRRWMIVRVIASLLVIVFAIGLYLFIVSNGWSSRGIAQLFEITGVLLMVCIPIAAGLDAIYLAGHLFHRELKEQTWDTLRTLPMTLRRLCFLKIEAAATALIPWVAFFFLGALLAYDEGPKEFFREFERDADTMFFVVCYCITLTAYALYLVCFFSLKTNPWLGIVLSTGVWFLTVFAGLFCCFGVFRLDGRDDAFLAFWLNSMAVAVFTLVLHVQILRMLRGEQQTG